MRNELLKRVILEETYFYEGGIEAFRKEIRLKEKRGFKLDWISEKEFNVSTNFSIGIFTGNGFMNFEGIKGEGIVEEISKGKTKVKIKTNIRVEIYLFIIAWVILFILSFFVENALFQILLAYPLGIIFLCTGIIYLWSIYRIQEKILFRKVKKYIEVELSKTDSQK